MKRCGPAVCTQEGRVLGVVTNLTVAQENKSKMILVGVMSGRCFFPSYFLYPIEMLEIKSYPRHEGTVFIQFPLINSLTITNFSSCVDLKICLILKHCFLFFKAYKIVVLSLWLFCPIHTFGTLGPAVVWKSLAHFTVGKRCLDQQLQIPMINPPSTKHHL